MTLIFRPAPLPKPAGATLPRQWRGTVPTARRKQRAWLIAGGSLSARLSEEGRRLSVQVLHQGRAPLLPHEAQVLGAPVARVGYVREVLLCVDGRPVVCARSVCRHPHASGAWRALRGLGSRPLADVLFSQSGIQRSALSYARSAPGSAWARALGGAAAGVGAAALLLSARLRRSLFWRRGAPLLVMEAFIAAEDPWRWPRPARRARAWEPGR